MAAASDPRWQVQFRDPPLSATATAPLQRELGRLLVGVSAIPAPIAPGAELRLLAITAEPKRIVLNLGFEDPVAALRLSTGLKDAAHAVSASVRPLTESARRHAQAINALATRIVQRVDAAGWARALALAKELRSHPVDVPMGFHRQIVAGHTSLQGQVRTGFRCNQDCGICWQGRHWGTFGSAQVMTWIEDLARAGARSLIISGGEPTLDPALPDYLRAAKTLGFDFITMETNAIRCGKGDFANQLREAGLDSAFVSLHSADPATSDRITRAPGTHGATVRGARALLGAGVRVRLNAVTTRQGLDTLPSMPGFVHETFGSHPLLEPLMISYPSAPYDSTLKASIVPDPDALRRALRETIARAAEIGVTISGLDGPCGPPLCAFDADPRVARLEPIPAPVDFRVYVPRCDGCAARHACFGVRPVDVEINGEDACVRPFEVLPVQAADSG